MPMITASRSPNPRTPHPFAATRSQQPTASDGGIGLGGVWGPTRTAGRATDRPGRTLPASEPAVSRPDATDRPDEHLGCLLLAIVDRCPRPAGPMPSRPR